MDYFATFQPVLVLHATPYAESLLAAHDDFEYAHREHR
jgi:hypothetical protein